MRLDYGTQLNPYPITLSIGTIRKPTLGDISKITFDMFDIYEVWLKMTPEFFYTKIKQDGKQYWDSLSNDDKEKLTVFDIIESDEGVLDMYVTLFNFFFVEKIVFKDGFFIVLKNDSDSEEIEIDNIKAVISREIFPQVIYILQQICCIDDEKDRVPEQKFKNKTAKKLFEKMKRAAKENKSKKRNNDFTIPNIISSVSSMHNSINLINVWDLTIFQLLDTFNRLRNNNFFKIDSTRVSVWGDEKKTFDESLWYKNEFDK